MIPVNEYQTKITEELLNSLNDEVRTELLDIINNIQFIQNLISPDRKRAKDLPRDNQGRIIVDICNPHILVNIINGLMRRKDVVGMEWSVNLMVNGFLDIIISI